MAQPKAHLSSLNEKDTSVHIMIFLLQPLEVLLFCSMLSLLTTSHYLRGHYWSYPYIITTNKAFCHKLFRR